MFLIMYILQANYGLKHLASRKMRKFKKHRPHFINLLLLLLPYWGLQAQVQQKVHWRVHPPKQALKVGDTFELIFVARIEPDWYLYASDFDPELGPMVTELEIENIQGAKAIDKLQSINPQRKYDDIFEGEISFFKKEGRFRQIFQVVAPELHIKGSINYQVCSDVTGMCIPGSYDFSLDLQAATKPEANTAQSSTNQAPQADTNTHSSASASSSLQIRPTASQEQQNTSLQSSAQPQPALASAQANESLALFALAAFLAGIAAIFTPCVFPMIPMTVSYFLKGNPSQRPQESQEAYAERLRQARKQGIGKAIVYGASIVGIYTLVGTIAAVFLGAEFANEISTHWLANLIFFLVFVVFALSFFGMFDITLPSSFLTKIDKQADRGGLIGIFFMALTLVLVSFSCTVPIAGSLLIASAGGQVLKPVVGMLSFSLAFALPFTLFAAFPTTLSKLPRSGGWLNTVKVVLGFIELALAFKFLSVADQVYHWGLLDREVYLAIWIAIGIGLTMYLFGKLQLPHDSPVEKLSVPRLILALASLSFVVYLIPGMFGAPLSALSGYLPPMSTFNKLEVKAEGNLTATDTDRDFPAKVKYGELFKLPHGLRGFFDYEEALAYARRVNKPLFIDFTGHGCVNCREMEAKVWSDARVLKLLREDYVVVALYVDDKTPLPEAEQYISTYDGKRKNTIGRKYFDFQITAFGANAQPYYCLLDTQEGLSPQENLLLAPRGYDLNTDAFVAYLEEGLRVYNSRR